MSMPKNDDNDFDDDDEMWFDNLIKVLFGCTQSKNRVHTKGSSRQNTQIRETAEPKENRGAIERDIIWNEHKNTQDAYPSKYVGLTTNLIGFPMFLIINKRLPVHVFRFVRPPPQIYSNVAQTHP